MFLSGDVSIMTQQESFWHPHFVGQIYISSAPAIIKPEFKERSSWRQKFSATIKLMTNKLIVHLEFPWDLKRPRDLLATWQLLSSVDSKLNRLLVE
jgi:hypothetical protein